MSDQLTNSTHLSTCYSHVEALGIAQETNRLLQLIASFFFLGWFWPCQHCGNEDNFLLLALPTTFSYEQGFRVYGLTSFVLALTLQS